MQTRKHNIRKNIQILPIHTNMQQMPKKKQKISGKQNLHIRNWECPHCHTHHHRDHNAAINILNKGFQIVGTTVQYKNSKKYLKFFLVCESPSSTGRGSSMFTLYSSDHLMLFFEVIFLKCHLQHIK